MFQNSKKKYFVKKVPGNRQGVVLCLSNVVELVNTFAGVDTNEGGIL